MSLVGLLLAAGRGRRMGGNKQFHIVTTPDGDKPLVVAALETIAPVCDSIVVVLGHRADEVAAMLKKGSGVFSVKKTPDPFVFVDPDAAMIDSIKAGLRAIDSRRATLAGQPAILLQLGDHPHLERSTLDVLLQVAAEHPDKAVMPTYQGSGGHPVVIPQSIAGEILERPCPGGLRQFWIERPELCVRVPVEDRSVVSDIDVT